MLLSFFFFKQKTAYEMRISDWSSDLCSSDPQVNFSDGRSLPLTAIVVHQRSLNSAEEDSPSGVRVRAKRQEQARFLANLVQGRQVADPSERTVVLGDFNAFEFNDGYGDSTGTVTSLPSAEDATVVPGAGADLVYPDLYALTFVAIRDVSGKENRCQV